MAGSNRVPKHTSQTMQQWWWTRITTCYWFNQYSMLCLRVAKLESINIHNNCRTKHTQPKIGIRVPQQLSIQGNLWSEIPERSSPGKRLNTQLLHTWGCIFHAELWPFFLYRKYCLANKCKHTILWMSWTYTNPTYLWVFIVLLRCIIAYGTPCSVCVRTSMEIYSVKSYAIIELNTK